jgi:CBS domain-containing protein
MATVGDLMSTDVVTVRPTDTLGHVARVLRSRNVGSAVVLDDTGRTVGIITERDLVESVASSRNPDVGTAQSWMSPDVRMIHPAASPAEAVRAMRDGGVRHLTVGDGERLLGVVSMRDLLAGTAT